MLESMLKIRMLFENRYVLVFHSIDKLLGKFIIVSSLLAFIAFVEVTAKLLCEDVIDNEQNCQVLY